MPKPLIEAKDVWTYPTRTLTSPRKDYVSGGVSIPAGSVVRVTYPTYTGVLVYVTMAGHIYNPTTTNYVAIGYGIYVSALALEIRIEKTRVTSGYPADAMHLGGTIYEATDDYLYAYVEMYNGDTVAADAYYKIVGERYD